MSVQAELMARNRAFADTFDRGDLPMLPRLRTLIVTCADARVDPAHVFGLDLGEVVVIRNNGGRVTRTVVEEIATLAVLVSAATQGREQGFNVILMQHTQCGAQRLADRELQALLKDRHGIDVSGYAITDPVGDLLLDIDRLAAAPAVPDPIVVSAMLYDVATGTVRAIAPETSLGTLRDGAPSAAAVDTTAR